MKKNIVQGLVLGIIAVLIVFNAFIVFKIKSNALNRVPFQYLGLKKSTVLVVIQEYECITCVDSLKIFNQVYKNLSAAGLIDVKGIILSETGTDKKGLMKHFNFPFVISNDFSILKRLNIRQTPLIIGLTMDNGICYSEVVPPGIVITDEYLKTGVLNRLYYFDAMAVRGKY